MYEQVNATIDKVLPNCMVHKRQFIPVINMVYIVK